MVTFPSQMSWVLTLKNSIREFKPHARTLHATIIVIIAMLTLCYPIMSHATLILYYHASMLTLLTLLISCAQCSLLATSMILRRLECTRTFIKSFHALIIENLGCDITTHVILELRARSIRSQWALTTPLAADPRNI